MLRCAVRLHATPSPHLKPSSTQPIIDYLKKRGVPDAVLADVAARHPRIFEYKASKGCLLADAAMNNSLKPV